MDGPASVGKGSKGRNKLYSVLTTGPFTYAARASAPKT